jgi:beta-RFAP synthase
MMVREALQTSPGMRVEVQAPARIHLGFLDLNGGLGRRFGSLGLTIDSLATRLSVTRGEGFHASGPGARRAESCARAFAADQGIEGGAQIRLDQTIPEHVGLGSGTQLSLAVGTALERLCGRDSGSRRIAQALKRGGRSGIGIGAFDSGGFIVDCGRGEHGGIPPVALRLQFPDPWRVLLLFDVRGQGLHGTQEVEAFARLPDFPEETAGRLCRLVMMKILPGLLEQRLAPVAEGIGEIQRAVGGHFAPAQGGCFSSPRVSEALAWLEGQGVRGTGQSSWGPTGFVLAADEDQALGLQRDLKRRFGELSPLRYLVVAGRNQGATVNVESSPACFRSER